MMKKNLNIRKVPKMDKKTTGTPMYNSVSIGNRYINAIQELVLLMVKKTKKIIENIYRSDSAFEYFVKDANIGTEAREELNLISKEMESLFETHGKIIAKRMIDQTDDHVKQQMMISLRKLSGGLTIKQSNMPEGLAEIYSAAISNNVSLIKSIQSQFFERIKGDVMRSIISPTFGGHDQLIKNLQKYGDLSYKRARMIGLHQSRNIGQAVSINRMKASGVKQGIWVHTAGTKEPRKRHKEFNGKIFDLEKGAPVGDNDGNFVQCGEEINCRCTFIPVVNFGDDE